jgi:hypothetical protein
MSSEKGTFSIYYGEGNMIYGPNGVDLSEFNCAIREITRPHESTFEFLCNWLMSGLKINQETLCECSVRHKLYHSRFDLGADATCKQR